MKSKSTIATSMKLRFFAGVILGCCALASALQAAPEADQKGFDTPKQAANALVQAADPFEVSALEAILGLGSEDLVASEDTVQDKNRATKFAAMAHEKSEIEIDPKNPKRATLSVGIDRVAAADSDRQPEREMVFRCQGRPRRDTAQAHRRERAGCDSRFAAAMSRLKRSTPRRSTMTPRLINMPRRSSAHRANRMALLGKTRTEPGQAR